MREESGIDKSGPPSGWDYSEGIPPGWEAVSPEGRFPGMLLSGETMVTRPQGGIIVIKRIEDSKNKQSLFSQTQIENEQG